MIQENLRNGASITAAAFLLMTGPGSAWAAGNEIFSADNLILSRTVYTGLPGTVTVNQTLPPNCVAHPKASPVNVPLLAGGTTAVTVACAKASADGTYPTVFNNDGPDGSFGVTSPIVLDQLTTAGATLSSLPIDSTQIVTSFSSKSELAVNKSLDGQSITFMGYHAGPGFVTGPNQLDVSNSNTPGVIDPTNPVVSNYYRSVAEVDAFGVLHVTDGNAYSGNNGRAAIKADPSSYYLTGNDNNGGLKQNLTAVPPVDQITTTQDGVDLINATGVEFLVPQAAPPVPPNIAKIGNFDITQVGFAADKAGKDNNFRGLTIFNHTLYVTKGSGGNGINTVYQVGTAGILPTSANAPNNDLKQVPITILPGLWNTLAADTATARYPFGIWFANATTLYVADEGDGTAPNAATDTKSGLQKWMFDGATWHLKYTLQNGLHLGTQYSVANGPNGEVYPTALNPAADGLRNLTGRVNTDGTVNIWAVTSTVSANVDEGADPNQLVFITDNLASPTLPANEHFTVLRTAGYGEVLRGVSFAPGTVLAAPNSGTACNGAYNGTFNGNVTVSAGQNCVFVGGTINGNVQLNGGTLSLSNVAVTGNVQVSGGGTFSIGPSAAIAGNLEVQHVPASAAPNQVCGSQVGGNIAVHNNDGAFLFGSASAVCTGNTVGGNIEVQNNTGATTIDGNTVTGYLNDHNNNGATAVFGNTVGVNLTCNQNNSITGGGNTAALKQGQCLGF